MDFIEVKLKMKWFKAAFILLVISGHSIEVNAVPQPEYIIEGAVSDDLRPDIVFLQHIRHKRDAPVPTAVPLLVVSNVTAPTQLAPAPTNATTVTAPVSTAAAAAVTPTNASATQAPANATDDSNRTTKLAKASTAGAPGVTQVPILGKDGAGQHWPNLTDTTPKVSDPISPDNYFSDVFESPEQIKAEHNLENLKYDNHTFYNSTFVGNASYFAEYWANISAAPAQTHDMLSNSHRKATTVKLSFMFPFYGHWIQTITVATGGFIYTGEHTHSWLAATQYIAPLMGNFDTSLDNSSRITMTDTGDHFTVFWERVTLREERDKPFTFAATLRKNGDIEFAYQQVPIPVHLIDDTAHPVKIGISDAYLTDKIIFYVRRKTVYEYHRVSFKNYEISNGTVLRLTALPTCLQYDSCDACLNHNTTFQCAWCENIQKCSSGTDRNKQDWQLRNCDNTLVSNATSCPAVTATAGATATAAAGNSSGPHTGGPYVTDGVEHHDADVRTLNSSVSSSVVRGAGVGGGAGAAGYKAGAGAGAARGGGAVGGAVAACACVALVCALAAWALYAFRNPHTRSGQLFIKYRPSQWNWRRGEARYTAATIHM